MVVLGRPYVLQQFFFSVPRYLRSFSWSPQNFAAWSEACSIYKCLFKNLGSASKKIWGQKC